MKNIAKIGVLAIALSISVTACENRSNGGEASGTDTVNTLDPNSAATDTATALDSTSTDTLGTTGNDSIQ